MVDSVTASNWNIRQVDPKAYGSAGNRACLWDIAREQLVKEGYVDMNGPRIQAKVDEIVAFHNQQTSQPGFRRINNPHAIGANQTIYTPPFSTVVPGGTKLKVGDQWSSPDRNTVMKVEAGQNQKGEATTQLRVYRDDGGGFGTAADHSLGVNVKDMEITKDGQLVSIDTAGKRNVLGIGQSINARLEVQNDGNVVLYGEKDGNKKAVLWPSNSQRIAPA